MARIRQDSDNVLYYYEEKDINDKLILNMRDLNRTLHILYDGKASQRRVLIILREVGTITQKDITERLDIRPASVSEVLTKLEGRGLISRELAEDDRRTMNISLTKKGEVFADNAFHRRFERHNEMFSCLADNEKETLLSLVEKINNVWDHLYR